ncbi:MAG: type VI secretion system baseplate subunit TssK [Gemmatimonadaceae bacterium]|nr:type VI secretion system baseplate subunit TssK [Gemmatimonadaceae bacterium]
MWTRGLLLDPQHLQAQDRYVESQLAFRARAVRPHAWGFSHVAIDDAALALGMLAVHDVAGLLPDGLAFDTRATDVRPAPRPLAALLPRDAERALVHLAVPAYRHDARNVAPPGERTTERFLLEWRDRADDAGSAAARPIPLATAHLQLVAAHEPRDGLAAMPLVALLRTADGRIVRDGDVEPPLLGIGASATLVARLAALTERLASVASLLAARRRERQRDVADVSALELGAFWTLYTINSHLPVLQHQQRTGGTPAAELCTTLGTLAMALGTVAEGIEPRAWPAYDHAAPALAIAARLAAIDTALDQLVPHRGATIALRERSPGIWIGTLPDDFAGETDELYLAVSTAGTGVALAQRVPQLCKVAAADQADALVRHALPGAPLRHVMHPPQGVPLRVACEYFVVTRDTAAWTRLARAREVAVYVPHDLPGAQCTLIALAS